MGSKYWAHLEVLYLVKKIPSKMGVIKNRVSLTASLLLHKLNYLGLQGAQSCAVIV